MAAPTATRVLLVHANPFQRVLPVPPYGLERIRAAAEAVGAQVELVDPYVTEEDPVAAAAAAARAFEPHVVGLGIRVVDDCIVVDTLDGDEGRPHDVTFFLPEVRRLRDALGEAAPDAVFVAGGAGFSGMPNECLEFLDVPYGVVGAGESAFRLLVQRVGAGRALDRVPGLVRRGDSSALEAYSLVPGLPIRRSELHAAINSIPVRTRIGCAMGCSYCVTANLARAHMSFGLDDVVAEVEAVVAHASEHGIAPVPVFFADDEFNLPDEKHPIALLSALQERGLERRLIWRGYFNPVPFSRELARLVRDTNGHASLTVDSASDTVLARNRKPFRRRHLDALIELLEEEGVSADLGLIFGLPGETDETIAETVAWVRALPDRIRVVYSLGARVYPHTPLAQEAARRPDLVLGDDPTLLSPTVYASPRPPRALARELAETFAGLRNVSRLGAGFRTGRTTVSDAYRAVTGGKLEWDDVLDGAERPGDVQGSPGRNLSSCMQVAIWHGRYDLASRAAARLARYPDDLPPGVSRLQVRTARVVFSLLARRRRRVDAQAA